MSGVWLPELDTPDLSPGHALFSDRDGGAIFDQHNVDNANHRYALWRIWDPENRPLVVIGLNPSTATHLVSDPTVTRCRDFAYRWGWGGLVMLNLFSFRSTDPEALEHKNRWATASGAGVVSRTAWKWPDLVTGGPEHDRYLQFFTAAPRAGMVLAAWGTRGGIAGRGPLVADTLRLLGVRLSALGVTKYGHPKHPLYIRKDTVPEAFAYP